MRNIALKIAYDGTAFLGWQATQEGSSIEETVQKVLEQILQEEIVLQAASRTDRGVHAEGQIVNFISAKSFKTEELQNSLNALLPKSIAVLQLTEMPSGFHPTLDVIGKEYIYEICPGPIQLPGKRLYSWHVPYDLDLENMQKGASYFLGIHDFSSFCNQRKDLNYTHKERCLTRCEISCSEEKNIKIIITGNHFLYKMVRNIVGTLVYIGRGKISPEEIPAILASKSRIHAGITAPSHGLVLKRIFYPQEISI